MTWFEWNTKQSLIEAPIKLKSYILPKEDSLPLFIIPLKVHNAFVMVGRSTSSVYKDILTETPSRYPLKLGEQEEPEEPGSSKTRPLWTQWARAARYLNKQTYRPKAAQADDNVYLCREDGVILFLDIKNSAAHMIESHHNAGNLDTTIDGAFAVIDLGEYSNDLLVAGGDSGSGGLWQFSARQAGAKFFPLLNWTPLNDCICLSSDTNNQLKMDNGSRTLTKNRLIGCTGRTKHGAISEMQLGSQANSLSSIEIRGALANTILDAWTMFPAQDWTLLLVSHPTCSSLLSIREGREPELLDICKGFMLDERTIGVFDSADGRICQITNQSITLSSPCNHLNNVLWHGDMRSSGQEILVADVGMLGQVLYAAIAVMQSGKYVVKSGMLGIQEEALKDQFELSTHPTCLAMHVSHQKIAIAVGSASGTLNIHVQNRDSPEKPFQIVAQWRFGEPFQICDDVVLLLDEAMEGKPTCDLVVCGLRNGRVLTLCVAPETCMDIC